ncbi:MAG: transcription antitermination factor NusB [candidate division Zixibacteria bacterium]|nr:transcription antitermination factor NusB [candidate division Zixibacteria bacterium]
MSIKVSLRHRARELVLQALYASEQGDAAPNEDFSNIVDAEPLPARALQFAHQLYDLTRTHRQWADERISQLAENWEINRMAAVDLAILRMAIVELQHIVDVPVKVVLNEAIELAKTFSTDDSSAFVNGILDNFVKQMEDSSRD